jgi:hypothetical protein
LSDLKEFDIAEEEQLEQEFALSPTKEKETPDETMQDAHLEDSKDLDYSVTESAEDTTDNTVEFSPRAAPSNSSNYWRNLRRLLVHLQHRMLSRYPTLQLHLSLHLELKLSAKATPHWWERFGPDWQLHLNQQGLLWRIPRKVQWVHLPTDPHPREGAP